MLNTKGQKLQAKEKNKATNQWLPLEPLFPPQDTKFKTGTYVKRSNNGRRDRRKPLTKRFDEAPTFSDQRPNWRSVSFFRNATRSFTESDDSCSSSVPESNPNFPKPPTTTNHTNLLEDNRDPIELSTSEDELNHKNNNLGNSGRGQSSMKNAHFQNIQREN